MNQNKTSKYLKYAIGEIILVVIGILIALQINNWNENRKTQKEQYFILNKLQSDIKSDIKTITFENEVIQMEIDNYIYCLEVLGRKKETTKENFFKKFGTIFSITSFEQNTTTFTNLVSSGKLELINNKELSDSIVKYYTNPYQGWDTAMRDYTRNIIAPYLFKFDHITQSNNTDLAVLYGDFKDHFYSADISSFDIESKSLEDYRKDLFIINIIRQKLYNYQGQLLEYKRLLKEMDHLVKQIEQEKIALTND
jgi:hypothetical protein